MVLKKPLILVLSCVSAIAVSFLIGAINKQDNSSQEEHKHVWEQTTAVLPTCSSQGFVTFSCACNQTDFCILTKLEHNIQSIELQTPTCETIGWNAYERCLNCNYTTYSEIPVLGHTWEEENQDGVITKVCETCQKSDTEISSEHIHAFTLHVLTQMATCKEQGMVIYECSCGERENITIAKVAHKFVNNACIYCGFSNKPMPLGSSVMSENPIVSESSDGISKEPSVPEDNITTSESPIISENSGSQSGNQTQTPTLPEDNNTTNENPVIP